MQSDQQSADGLPKNTGRFGPGNPGKPRGAKTKTTRVLREAIVLAAEQVGENGKGADGLVGYLRRVAVEDVKAFSGLLGRVLPLQITGEGGGAISVVSRIELVPMVGPK